MLRNLFFLVTLALVCSCDDGPDLVGPDDPPAQFDFDFDFDFPNLPPSLGGVNGSGNVVTESRALGPFHAVSFSGIGHLVLEQTGSPSLTITAEDNIQPLLVSEVVDGRLTLGVAPNTNLGRVQRIEFRLTTPALDELSVTGAASGDATNIDTDRLDVVVNGATTVAIAGRADQQDITIRGASTYDAAALESRSVTVDATGASRAVVRVSETLTARVRGASTVTYIGNPTVNVDGLPGTVRQQ